jgi:hypothetical protein
MEQAFYFERNSPGIVASEAEKKAARVAAELVAGVRAVENNVIVQPAIAGH